MLKIIPYLLSALMLSGCGTPTRRMHLVDLARLPTPRGFYGGSMYTPNGWVYLGSDPRHHCFRYTYTIDNGFHQRRILIRKEELTLSFETPLLESKERGVPVHPLINAQGNVYGFVRVTVTTPDGDWLNHPSGPLPTFEKSDPIKTNPLRFK